MISDISHFNHVWDDDSTHAFVSGVLAPFHHGSTVILGQVAIPPSPGARYIHDIPTVNALSSASLGALGAWPGLGPPAYVPPVMPLAPGSPQMAGAHVGSAADAAGGKGTGKAGESEITIFGPIFY